MHFQLQKFWKKNLEQSVQETGWKCFGRSTYWTCYRFLTSWNVCYHSGRQPSGAVSFPCSQVYLMNSASFSCLSLCRQWSWERGAWNQRSNQSQDKTGQGGSRHFVVQSCPFVFFRILHVLWSHVADWCVWYFVEGWSWPWRRVQLPLVGSCLQQGCKQHKSAKWWGEVTSRKSWKISHGKAMECCFQIFVGTLH